MDSFLCNVCTVHHLFLPSLPPFLSSILPFCRSHFPLFLRLAAEHSCEKAFFPDAHCSKTKQQIPIGILPTLYKQRPSHVLLMEVCRRRTRIARINFFQPFPSGRSLSSNLNNYKIVGIESLAPVHKRLYYKVSATDIFLIFLDGPVESLAATIYITCRMRLAFLTSFIASKCVTCHM